MYLPCAIPPFLDFAAFAIDVDKDKTTNIGLWDVSSIPIANKALRTIMPVGAHLPLRCSAAPLYMPEKALTNKLYSGIDIMSLWISV